MLNIHAILFWNRVEYLATHKDTGIHFDKIEQGKRNVSSTTLVEIAEVF